MIKTLLTFCSLLMLSNSVLAQSTESDEKAAWQALQEGKAVALMRHALAPGMGDPANFSINHCDTQRNLSEEGRQQAVTIGEKLRSHGIDNADVKSSHWCRCQETAQLLDIGTVEPSSMLNSFFQNRSTADQQTAAVFSAIDSWLQNADGPKVLVSHQVNISALTSEYTGSGDILIVTIDDGQIRVMHRMTN